MLSNRIAAGCGVATILVVIALSSGGLAVMEPVLLIVAGVVLLATFAPRAPLLHLIPKIGAPKVKLRLSIKDQKGLTVPDPSAEVVLRVAVFNGGSGELERGRLNVLVPESTEIRAVDGFGKPVDRGELMVPTSEQLLPDTDSNYWYDRKDFDPQWTLVHYGLRFPRPGRFPVRVKFASKTMYGGDIEETHDILVGDHDEP